MSPNPSVSRRPLLGRLQHFATVGDRWFVAGVRAVRSVGVRARRLVGGPFATLVAQPSLAALPEKRCSATDECIPVGGCNQLDVLAATSFEDAVELDQESFEPARAPSSASVLVSEPPGVVPLWRALGRVVSQHAESGYRSLQSDDRFWALVRLIQSCTSEGPEPGAASERRLTQDCEQ
jgi:hypothetical protein